MVSQYGKPAEFLDKFSARIAEKENIYLRPNPGLKVSSKLVLLFCILGGFVLLTLLLNTVYRKAFFDNETVKLEIKKRGKISILGEACLIHITFRLDIFVFLFCLGIELEITFQTLVFFIPIRDFVLYCLGIELEVKNKLVNLQEKNWEDTKVSLSEKYTQAGGNLKSL